MGGVVVERVARHWIRGDGICPHCGQGVETVERRFWCCPVWRAARQVVAPSVRLGQFRRALP
eukprot:10826150-Lingulodinium_polyedra.AAC.1